MNSAARALLEKLVNRPRFNDSPVYKLYLDRRYPEYSKIKRLEHNLYKTLLADTDAKLVFDVGANGGAKAIIFADLAERVVAVEPSPAAISILKQRFAKNTHVTVVAAGLSSQVGAARFHMFGDGDCYNTFSTKWINALTKSDRGRPAKAITLSLDVSILTIDCLIEEYGTPDYIKIDVEGHELEVVRGLTRPVPLVSFECNLPEFQAETMEVIRTIIVSCRRFRSSSTIA